MAETMKASRTAQAATLPKAWQGSENAIKNKNRTQHGTKSVNDETKHEREISDATRRVERQSGGEASRAGRSRSKRAALGHVHRVDKETRKRDDTRSAAPNYLQGAEGVGKPVRKGMH